MTFTPYSDSLSLGLQIFVLNPPFPISRRLILQQARGQSSLTGHLLPLLVRLRFHVLFHSP